VPAPARRPRPVRSRWAVAYWTAAVVLYGVVGALYPPAFLLGFWESIPALLLVTWIASRLFPRPVPPLPPREQR
jgi:Na+/proline symporter